MKRLTCLLPSLMAALLLGACGGGDGDKSALSAPPQRGALLKSPPTKLASYSIADLLAQLTGNSVDPSLLQLVYTPKCAIDVYQLQYETVGGESEATTASGALMVPTGSGGACTGAHPIILYAHGTTPDRNFNIADLTSSSNDEGLLLAAIFAASGYIVVAPNYAGYDTSTLTYHPYLDADQQSKDMIDALAAARTALPLLPGSTVSDNAKLFVTGYSQGGFVAMATHRALQAAGASVTASAPMSGPYTLAAFGDEIFYGQVPFSAPENLTLLIESYQHAYGNIYTSADSIFAPKYAAEIGSLLPSTTAISELYTEGKLPSSQLFSNLPPTPAWAAYTPATMPTNLATVFATGFGVDALILNAYRLAYLEDAQAAPDGGFPTVTTGVPAASPQNALRQALKTNDLRNWAPSSPMLLCGGDEDPTVFYSNTVLMQAYWTTNVPPAAVEVLDIDAGIGITNPFTDFQDAFAAAKALVATQAVASGATDGGASAVLENYHAGLVAPFCVGAVRSFFDGF